MLDVKFIRENKKTVATALKNRGKSADLEKLLKLDKERRSLIGKIDEKRALQKKAGKDIAKGKKLKTEIKKLETQLGEKEPEIKKILQTVPNIPAKEVPTGKNEDDNKKLRTVGKPTKFNFKPKDHEELGKALDIIDIERAAKISGSRFSYIKGGAASLQFALIQYVYDIVAKDAGFIPIVPPVIVKRDTAEGSGHPEAVGDEAYHLTQDDMFLVGTSEQSILPMYKDEILNEEDLPLRYLGYSTCFRREAGSYGKDVKGIIRQHQFDKLEMFSFCKPKDSKKEHDNLLKLQEKLMKGLELPYRVMLLSTGDLGFPAVKTYDIETWIPSQDRYRETHSTSNCTDFQTRGFNIRYRRAQSSRTQRSGDAGSRQKTTEYVHAINGTAFAIGRTLVAILENNQQKDGSIIVPKVLQKYCGFKVIK